MPDFEEGTSLKTASAGAVAAVLEAPFFGSDLQEKRAVAAKIIMAKWRIDWCTLFENSGCEDGQDLVFYGQEMSKAGGFIGKTDVVFDLWANVQQPCAIKFNSK